MGGRRGRFGEVTRAGLVLAPSAPAEGHVSRAVPPFLHQWLVELSTSPGVNAGAAVLTIVLQASDIGTEEGGKLASAPRPLALVTHLVIQDVRLHLHLRSKVKQKNYLSSLYTFKFFPRNQESTCYQVMKRV